jgi:hypothetical protein
MTHYERTDLLQQLIALEGQSEQVQHELRRFRERLLRYEANVARKAAGEVGASEAAEVVATAPASPPIERVDEAAESPLASSPAPPSSATVAVTEERERSYADLEFWLGGRGLLLLGVTALVLAVGFFVKEAIERGWLGATVRVLLGAVVGVVAVVAGERIRALGYRTYGLWLAAGGFAAIYLSIWAAAALYSLVSTPVAFVLLVAVVGLAAVTGLRRGSESFVALAAFGGYLAPILLQVETDSNVFGLGYLGLLSGTGLWVAYRGRWAYLASVALAGGSILPIANAGDPQLHVVYLALLVATALTVSLRRSWHYLSLLAVALGCLSFGLGHHEWGVMGMTFVSGAAAISAAGLWVAHRAKWPYLAALAVAGGTLLPLASPGDPHLHGVYLVALVVSALLVSRHRRWHLVSVLTVGLGWLSYWLGSDDWALSGIGFAAYAAALWLAGWIAWAGIRDWARDGAVGSEPEDGTDDRLALHADPVAFGYDIAGLGLTLVPPWLFFAAAMVGIQDSAYRDRLDEIGFGIALVLGAVHVGHAVWSRPGTGAGSRFWRAALGSVFWLVAPAVLWEDVGLARAWLVEGLVLTSAGVALRNYVSRGAGLAGFILAVITYWGSIHLRPEDDAAFLGAWALTGLVACLGLAAWSLAGVRPEQAEPWETIVRPFLLLASGVFFLGWGTGEIIRFYDLLADAERWTLARDLSISAFWMAYAAALLATGFGLKQPPIRWAGLGMALIAAAKVFLYDLSQLSQLYRIGSFVLLAFVLLALSFRYQRLRKG